MAHYPSNTSTNKPRRGIPKSQAYIAGIFTPEYDLEEMIIAFGVKAVSQMVIERYADLKEGKRYNSRHKDAAKTRQRIHAHVYDDSENEVE